MISISNRKKSRRLAFFRRIVTEDIFFSESGKIIQDKIFELCLRISERENLPQKFIGSCLGYSYPYPSTSVPKLNDAARFNQNRPRVWQPFVMAVLIEQGEVFPRFPFLKAWPNNLSYWGKSPLPFFLVNPPHLPPPHRLGVG